MSLVVILVLMLCYFNYGELSAFLVTGCSLSVLPSAGMLLACLVARFSSLSVAFLQALLHLYDGIGAACRGGCSVLVICSNDYILGLFTTLFYLFIFGYMCWVSVQPH